MNGHIMFPKELFVPPYSSLSTEGKVIYSLMLDRLSLSKKNGVQWEYDNEVFIYYSLEEVCLRLNCGHDKALKVLRELEKVGLIRRVRQGLCKPNRVFVDVDLLDSGKSLYSNRNYRHQECDVSESNNTETINTELIYTDPPIPRDPRVVETVIKENIHYDILCEELNAGYLDPIVELIVDVFCNQTETVSIGGSKRNLVDVCQRFLSLNDLHIRYVYRTMLNTEKEIRSPRGFLLKVLYDAPLNSVFA